MRGIIFCVETKKQANTDGRYVEATVKHYYALDGMTGLRYVYFNGKGNYNKGNTLKQIQKYQKDFTESQVVYVIDTDNISASAESNVMNENIKNYCLEKGYKYIWFCYDVEEVFWHKSVPDAEKVKEAGKIVNYKWSEATVNALSSEAISRYRSNFLRLCHNKLLIFDEK